MVLSYAINFALGGFDPYGYHLLNILIHAANALLLGAIVLGLTRKLSFAFATALLFGVHPISTESVAWISGRTDLLATFFFLLSFLLSIRQDPPEDRHAPAPSCRRWLMAGCALSFFLALLSKESSATLPGAIMLYECAFRRGRAIKLGRLVPLLGAFGIYLVCRYAVLGFFHSGSIYFVANPLVHESFLPRLATGLVLFGKYLQLLVLPAHLSVDYSCDSIPIARSFLEMRVVIATLSLAVLLIIGLISWKRRPGVFLGLGFFFVTGGLIFSNAFFVFAPMFAERFMYLPATGFVLAGTSLVNWGTSKVRRPWCVVINCILLALVALGFSIQTHSRNLDWKSELRIFRSAVETNPTSAVGHYFLGTRLYKTHEFEAAARSYAKALEIYPAFGSALAGMGNVALAKGDLRSALRYFENAVEIDPTGPDNYVGLGAVYGQLGQIEAALRATETALRFNPSSAQIYNNLGNTYYLKGEIPRAIENWQNAVELSPLNAETLYNLGYAYEKMGEMPEAKNFYDRFLSVASKDMEGLEQQVRLRLNNIGQE